MVILDGSGNVIGRQSHLPFGEEIGGSGQQDKHHFTSYERDSETNTDYAVNRQYAQGIGRFNRPDPYGGSYNINNPQSLNRYTYVKNNPINFTDPLGLFCGPGTIYNWETHTCDPIGAGDPTEGSGTPGSDGESISKEDEESSETEPVEGGGTPDVDLMVWSLADALRNLSLNCGFLFGSIEVARGIADNIVNQGLRIVNVNGPGYDDVVPNSPRGFFGGTWTFRDVWEESQGGNTIQDDAIVVDFDNTLPSDHKSIILGPGFFKWHKEMREAILVHEFAHIFLNQNDIELAKNIAAKGGKDMDWSSERAASNSISRFILNGCPRE